MPQGDLGLAAQVFQNDRDQELERILSLHSVVGDVDHLAILVGKP
jgi:hypothetical protein